MSNTVKTGTIPDRVLAIFLNQLTLFLKSLVYDLMLKQSFSNIQPNFSPGISVFWVHHHNSMRVSTQEIYIRTEKERRRAYCAKSLPYRLPRTLGELAHSDRHCCWVLGQQPARGCRHHSKHGFHWLCSGQVTSEKKRT